MNSVKGTVIDSVEFCEYTQNTFHTVIGFVVPFYGSQLHGQSNILCANCYGEKSQIFQAIFQLQRLPISFYFSPSVTKD